MNISLPASHISSSSEKRFPFSQTKVSLSLRSLNPIPEAKPKELKEIQDKEKMNTKYKFLIWHILWPGGGNQKKIIDTIYLH